MFRDEDRIRDRTFSKTVKNEMLPKITVNKTKSLIDTIASYNGYRHNMA